MLVPARGYNDSIGGVAAASDVFALGPVPSGVWLRRLNISWQSAGASLLVLWVGLGRSADTDQGAIESAQTLVDAGRASVFGRRALNFGALGAGASRMVLDIGRFVLTGPVWVIGHALAPVNTWELQVSLETLQAATPADTQAPVGA